MKKDVITIIVLLLVIGLLCGGIFFVVKTDVFSPKKEEITEIDKNENELENSENDNNEEKKSDQKEELTPEETTNDKKGDTTNNKSSENKVVEKPKVDTPTVNVVKPSVTKPQGSNNTNKKPNSSNNETSPNEENKNPDLPEGAAITCTMKSKEEDFDMAHTVIGIFSSDAYIKDYKETFSFDYTEYYEPFDDEVRAVLESELKQVVMYIYEPLSNIVTFSSNSNGNIINVDIISDRKRLKEAYPDSFTLLGEYYYDNFAKVYEDQGYSCSL